jgi:hypothetical protein
MISMSVLIKDSHQKEAIYPTTTPGPRYKTLLRTKGSFVVKANLDIGTAWYRMGTVAPRNCITMRRKIQVSYVIV